MTEPATEALRAAATGTAVAKKEGPKNFPAMLDHWKGEIARALPRHLNADRMARIALTCFRSTPKLGECDPKSVFAAVIQAAQLGLEPGLMGEAYLIPYKTTCQLIPGYAGLIKLAKQTGQVVDIYAMAVREKDKFSCAYGLNRDIQHTPLAGVGGFPAAIKARGEIIGFYAVAVFKDGSRTFVLMGRDQVETIRDNSTGYQMSVKYNKDSPWKTHFEEMGNKTVIRRLCKTLPKSPELAQALALEDAHGAGKDQRLDLKEAIDGSYVPVQEADEPIEGEVVIDADTGEITTTRDEATAAAKPSSRTRKPAETAPASNPTTAASNAAPTIRDALHLVNSREYDSARDLVRAQGFSDLDRTEIETAIKRHMATGEQV